MKNSTLCYIENNGCYLMLHRDGKKKNDINLGKWIGIGGKFEENESPDECIRREVFEETGLSPSEFTFRGIVTFCQDGGETEYMHLFTAKTETRETTECTEGTLAFVPINDVFSLPLWEGDRVFLRLLKEDAPPFLLKLVYQKDRLMRVILNGKEQ